MKKLILIALAISFTGILVNAKNKISQDSLIVYYPFNNDFNDHSGNNYNAKVNGSVLTGTKNKACFFDGINDYIEIQGVETLNTVKQLTVSCWIKPMKAERYVPWISKANEDNRKSQWRLCFGPDARNEVSFVFHNGEWNDYNFLFQFEMNRWYHVLYLIDNMNHTASIYIDGKNIKAFDIGELSTSHGSLFIGCQNGAKSFYQGLIDEILIYNRLLKESEIEKLYNQLNNSVKAKADTQLVEWASQIGHLHEFIVDGDLDKVKVLIEQDSTLLELKDRSGSTPLIKACQNGNIVMVNFLIDNGADVNASDRWKHTPLTRACGVQEANLPLVQLLINKGADINWQGINGNTPLHWAAYRGNLEIAKILINNGADINIDDKYDGPIETSSIFGTILEMAINGNVNEDMVILLIESGVNINKKDFNGNSPLHLAAFKGYTDITRSLIDHGAELNAVNNFNRTPLYYAAKHGYKSVADLLIEAGADENAIVEANYGNATQLTEKLKEGEAYIWQMGGYVIKTKEHLLLFNSATIGESPDKVLANGHLNPDELKGQNIIEFITYPERWWPFIKSAFDLAKNLSEVDYVIYPKPSENNTMEINIPVSQQVIPNENYVINGMKVHTIPALAGGLACIVEADGLNVYYGGLHVCGNRTSEIEGFRKEIDYLKPFGPVDIAFLTVHSHSNSIGTDFEQYFYLLDQLSPKVIYLFGANIGEQYTNCAEVLGKRNIKIVFPESRQLNGERFHYIRE